MKTYFIIIAIVILLGLVGVGIYFYQIKGNSEETSHGPCLSDNEIASYEIIERKDEVSLANIFIKNKEANKEVFSFQIELPIPGHVHPIELHRCGVYATRSFNYDYIRKQALPDYKIELWQYRYDGTGESLVFLSGPISGSLFGTDFRINPSETYVILKRSYLGNPNYALVIKDLKTKEDVFVLKHDDLINKYSAPEGGLALGGWRDDGKYFNGVIHVAARTLAFFRIEVDSWKTEVFIVPAEASIVSTISESGQYITYNNGPGWIAIHETAEQIYEEWRKEGKKVSLFIYNLFTKEKITLAIVDDPGWDFKTKWISDTELQYELPTGEKKIYTIEQ